MRYPKENRAEASLRPRVHAIVENGLFASHLQPVIDLRARRHFGYELLNRPFGVQVERFYALALKWGYGARLNDMAIDRARRIARVSRSPVFVNVFPGDLRAAHLEAAANHGLILELSEQAPAGQIGKIRNEIHTRGVSVALDDFGKGHANFQTLFALEPPLIKLDRSLISDIHQSTIKQDTAGLLARLALRRFGLIAEGIERPEELSILEHLGVRYGQGYLLGRPKRLKYRFRP